MPVRTYVGTDPERSFAGVGLHDLEQEEWDAIPTHIQESVDASDLYTTPIARAAKAKAVTKDDDEKRDDKGDDEPGGLGSMGNDKKGAR